MGERRELIPRPSIAAFSQKRNSRCLFRTPGARTGGFFGNVTNQREPTLEYLTHFNLLLAQVSEAKPAAPAEPPQAPGLAAFLPAIVGAMVLYYFLIIRPERRKQSTHRSQLDLLKKN